jgi:ABC-type Fe3+-hydroxamate transport system substrate-binding protein
VTRVVSLVPSITETLKELPGAELVAVTRFCETSGVPTVGGTKNPDIEAVVRLRPDVVFMDVQENRRSDAEQLSAAGLTVVSTDVCSVDDVLPAMNAIRAAVGANPLPSAVPAPFGGLRRKVFVPIWRRPWMTISEATYGSSILSSAGLDNVYAGSPEPYPTVDLDDAAARRPDFVLAPSEPYKFAEKHRDELETVAPMVFVDGQDLFWWGARTAGAVVRLRQMAQSLARE